MIVELVNYIIFPGALLVVILSIILVWLMRKITARLENRKGPPFMQPLYDFAKLLAKERVYPEDGLRNIQHFMPIIQFIIALFMSFFLPIFSDEGLISFTGDLFFFLFLLGLHGASVFFIGWASKNPYSNSGAGRVVMVELSLEIPLALSMAGLAIMNKSMRISEITTAMSGETISLTNPKSMFLIIPWFILFFTTIIATLGALELNPFSAGHAETEIVAGWMTELTGPDLALVKLSEFINLFNLSAIIVALFLGGPTVIENNNYWITGLIAFSTFVIKSIIIVFIISFIKTLSSRMRVDQTVDILWRYLLPISLAGIYLILLINKYGGV